MSKAPKFKAIGKTLYEAMYQQLVKKVENLQSDALVHLKMNKPLVVDHYSLAEVLDQFCEIVKHQVSNTLSKSQVDLYIIDPSTKKLMSIEIVIQEWINAIQHLSSHCSDVEYRRKVRISSFNKLVEEVISSIRHNPYLGRQLKPLDRSQYIALENCIIDRQTRKPVRLKKKFDALSRLPWSYLSDRDFESSNNHFYKYAIEKLFYKDWSYDNKNDRATTLLQVCLAAIEGDGRQSIVSLFGGGNNGKSSLIKMCANLVGRDKVVNSAIYQLDQDSHLDQINVETMLIAAAEAPAFVKVNNVSWSNAKMLSTQDPISISVKFKSNRDIMTTSLILNASNEKLNLPETNGGTTRRFIAYPYPERSEMSIDSKIDIDKLINDRAFIEYFGNWILRNVKEFDKFYVSKDVADYTRLMVDESDMSYTFIEDTIDLVNGIQYISTKHLYMMFVDWCKINQPTTRIKSNVSFTKEVSKYLARYGYKLEHQRKSFNLSNNSIQAMIKYQAKLSNFDKSEQSQYFEKMIDPIDEKEINEVKSKLDKNEINLQNHHELTQRQSICIEYLATDGHTTAMQLVD